jgi:hypothetical protein
MSKFFRQMTSLQERDDKERKSRLELVKSNVAPTVVVTPTVDSTSTEQEETATPHVGATPTVLEAIQTGTPVTEEIPSTYFVLAPATPVGVTPSEGVTPTVGVTLQKVSYSKGLPPSQISGHWVSLSSGKHYPANRVLRVDIAQTSLGLGELHVYRVLWTTAGDKYLRVLSEQKECRRVSIGYDALARLANFNEKSIRDLLPKLKDKFVLSEVAAADSCTRQGKTYDVYSYQQILERQRAAGLCYVIKNGKAVEFVHPLPSSESVLPTVGATPSVVEPHTETVGVTGVQSVGVTPTPLEKEAKRKESQSTSTYHSAAPPELYDGLSKIVVIDRAAVNRIWSESNEVVPGISPAEVVRLFEQRARPVYRNKRIDNPIGLLLNTIKEESVRKSGIYPCR